MKPIYLLLAVALTASVLTGPTRAQETNAYPKSNLELFEAPSGFVIIRSVDEIGAVPGKLGGVTIRCREARDVATNRRQFGVLVIVTQAQGAEDTTVVDYDELDALILAVDYVGKVDWSVTSMGPFEAGYTTRSGLKVASFSSVRSGLIEAFMLSNRQVRCRSALTLDQLSRVRVLLEQAKRKIEILEREK